MCVCGSFEQEESSPFKEKWTIEIKRQNILSMVEFKKRSDPCAHTSQPIEYKLTCHIRQKPQSLFFFLLNENNALFVQLRIKGKWSLFYLIKGKQVPFD